MAIPTSPHFHPDDESTSSPASKTNHEVLNFSRLTAIHWGGRNTSETVGVTDFRRLRFRKDIVRELCNLLRPDLQPQTRLRIALSVATKVTIALNFYVTGSFQSATADISNISHFFAHHSIYQITDALYKRRDKYTSFPMSREKQMEWQINAEMFINRKGVHFLNVQLVCDHHRKIMAVDPQFPGSSHNAFILRQTGVPGGLSLPNQNCGWLLGDKGYPLCTPAMLTPLRNPRTAVQHAYNDSHSATRSVIEQCIGILKQRFRCLDFSGGVLQYSPEWISLFVVACCMLHNLAIMRGQPLEDELAVAHEEEAQEEDEDEED
uniref:putative nuclease HARBI1 n=1 Tax=Pristiophorus japonicus TaxID=55135 RepID=UPI00398EFA7D